MLARILLVVLAAWLLPREAAAQLDPLTNAGACPVSTGYGAADTSIVVATGCGASLPTAAVNYAYCNVTDYPNNCKNASGALDPNYEIMRCTRSSDTLTCTRAQEFTSASTKNTAGKTYWVSTLTAKTFSDIDLGKLSALEIDAGALKFDASLDKLELPAGASYPGSDPSVIQVVRTITTPPNTPPGAVNPLVGISGTFAQSGAVNQGRIGLGVTVADDASVVDRAVSGAANNGSGLIRITTSVAHGWATGDRINVYGVVGTTEANGVWTITVITTTTFDLQGSTFTNAYTSGGTATNRGLYYAIHANVSPAIDRSSGGPTGTGTSGDDVAVIAVVNSGPAAATDGIWITDGVASGVAFHTLLSSDSNANHFLKFNGTSYIAGLDFSDGSTNGGTPMVKLGNSHDIEFGTGAGTKLGTATGQKIGFWNATPVAQPSSTAEIKGGVLEATGLMASGGAANLDLDGGALTAGSASISGNVAVDSTTFCVDAATNRVGLGTCSPQVFLDANGINTSITASFDSYGNASNLRLRRANGDSGATTRAAAGNNLGTITFWGAVKDDTASGATFNNAKALIRGIALEDFTTTANGTKLETAVTAPGTTANYIRQNIQVAKALTNNTAIDVVTATMASGSMTGGRIEYLIEVTDGTDYQAETGTVYFSAVNKAGTVTAGATEANTQQTVSAGTLTTTWAISTATSPIISINANSSLTPSGGYPRITFDVYMNGRQSFTLP